MKNLIERAVINTEIEFTESNVREILINNNIIAYKTDKDVRILRNLKNGFGFVLIKPLRHQIVTFASAEIMLSIRSAMVNCQLVIFDSYEELINNVLDNPLV